MYAVCIHACGTAVVQRGLFLQTYSSLIDNYELGIGPTNKILRKLRKSTKPGFYKLPWPIGALCYKQEGRGFDSP
jgi:hypothetical protein